MWKYFPYETKGKRQHGQRNLGTGRHGDTVEGCMNEVHHARQIGSWIACLRRKEERAQTKLLSVNATESVATGFSSCGSSRGQDLTRVYRVFAPLIPPPSSCTVVSRGSFLLRDAVHKIFVFSPGGNTRSQIKARFLPRMRRPIKVKFAVPVGISPPILVLDNRPFIRIHGGWNR